MWFLVLSASIMQSCHTSMSPHGHTPLLSPATFTVFLPLSLCHTHHTHTHQAYVCTYLMERVEVLHGGCEENFNSLSLSCPAWHCDFPIHNAGRDNWFHLSDGTPVCSSICRCGYLQLYIHILYELVCLWCSLDTQILVWSVSATMLTGSKGKELFLSNLHLNKQNATY